MMTNKLTVRYLIIQTIIALIVISFCSCVVVEICLDSLFGGLFFSIIFLFPIICYFFILIKAIFLDLLLQKNKKYSIASGKIIIKDFKSSYKGTTNIGIEVYVNNIKIDKISERFDTWEPKIKDTDISKIQLEKTIAAKEKYDIHSIYEITYLPNTEYIISIKKVN